MAQPEPGGPAPHPLPPASLAQVALPLLITGDAWYRMYAVGRDPLFFGRTGRHRFDAPAGEYGVLYAAGDAHCAFIETFGRRLQIRLVTSSQLRATGLARIEVSRSLHLVDVTGPGLAHLGADARLAAGDYALAQRWALALYEHPDTPDGIYYRSRHDPSRFCVAIYERAASSLSAVRVGSLTEPANTRLLQDILDTYQLGLIEDPEL